MINQMLTKAKQLAAHQHDSGKGSMSLHSRPTKSYRNVRDDGTQSPFIPPAITIPYPSTCHTDIQRNLHGKLQSASLHLLVRILYNVTVSYDIVPLWPP